MNFPGTLRTAILAALALSLTAPLSCLAQGNVQLNIRLYNTEQSLLKTRQDLDRLSEKVNRIEGQLKGLDQRFSQLVLVLDEMDRKRQQEFEQFKAQLRLPGPSAHPAPPPGDKGKQSRNQSGN